MGGDLNRSAHYLDPLLCVRDGERILRGMRVNEERDLITQSLHLEETLATEDLNKMRLPLRQVSRSQCLEGWPLSL
jgi:hypothetical protein